ncbi:MAG: hypoxanthine phosphoribosyltransferase [Clostridia bacterium]|nr:hypoxanthine phosphoribosyltransferase [Clostridia bacterium]MBQ4620645.1 hypoxanthine phosphoribosyltransferase [Clostridia bacterium]MBQ9856506.1 hypoxanthine phosphoribosyltransferase [Clostridia bacterium]
MKNDMKSILLDSDTIRKRVHELGQEITRDYQDEAPLMICILKGSVVFYADLVREIDLNVGFEFMTASSYGSATVSSGEVKIVSELDNKIVNRHVILVEDIVDSGRTIAYIKNDMLKKGVKSLKVCALLDKPDRRVTDVQADYCGFVIPDEFVVGYGLDFDQKYRNFPHIGVLKNEMYENNAD